MTISSRGNPMYSPPVAYLLTFRCYGSWLPGDARGWTQDGDRPGQPMRRTNAGLESECDSRTDPGIARDLTNEERSIADETIRLLCNRRVWSLHALNVRTNHVHAVVSCPCDGKQAINDLKSAITRRFRKCGVRPANKRVWSKGGSQRALWTDEQIADAVDYVMNRQ